jgi:hypothetical protein
MTEVDKCDLNAINKSGWHLDAEHPKCELCRTKFTFMRRRHHCRFCGRVVCDACSKNRCNSHRICDTCFNGKNEYNISDVKRENEYNIGDVKRENEYNIGDVKRENEYNIGDCIILESVRGNIHNFLLVGIVEIGNYIYYIVTKNGIGEHFIQYDKTRNEISFVLVLDNKFPNFGMNKSYKKIMKKCQSGIFDKLLKTSILFDSRTNECIMGGKKFKQGDTITFYAKGSLPKSITSVQSSPHSLYQYLTYNVTAYVENIIPSNFSDNIPTQVSLRVTSGNILTHTTYNSDIYTSPILANSTIVLHNSKVESNTMVDYGEIYLTEKGLNPDNISEISVNDVVKSQDGGNKHRKNKNKKSKRVVKRYISKRYKNRRNKVTKRSKRSKKLRRR